MISKPNPWKRILRIFIILIVILAVLYLAICTYAVYKVTEVPPEDRAKPIEPLPSEFGVDYEDITFPARYDDLEIAGWYLPNEEANSAIIVVHGRHENRATAMERTFPKFAAELQNAGYAVLMYDVRGHGKSAVARYDYGLKAKNDVLGAADWLMSQGFQAGNIGAVGISLGGGAVNFAVAEEPAIGAVVTESTYSDLNPIIEDQWQNESGLPNFFLPGVYLMHQILFGYDLRDAVPIDVVRGMAPRPVLVVHCRVDSLIPVEQAEAMVDIIPNAEHWYIEDGCDHAGIYTIMPEVYENTIISFFDKNLP